MFIVIVTEAFQFAGEGDFRKANKAVKTHLNIPPQITSFSHESIKNQYVGGEFKDSNTCQLYHSVYSKLNDNSTNLNLIQNDFYGIKPECPYCFKHLGSLSSLKIHIRDLHSGNTQVPCRICNRLYRSQNSLSNHMSIYHK